METEQQQKCGWCQSVLVNPLKCAQCRAQPYCNRECQKKHWSLHKTRCQKTTAALIHCTMEEVNECLDNLLKSMGGRFDALMHENAVRVLGQVKPLDTHWSQFLEVRASPVHGQGVFATRHLPKGAVLTCYPCHLIAIDRAVMRVLPDDVPLDTCADNLLYWGAHYAFDLDQRIKVIGVPSQYNERRLLGHMINDSSLVNIFSDVPIQTLADPQQLLPRMLTYYDNVLTHTNCTFRKCRKNMLICIVAQRENQPGEELLINYGMDYWLAINYGGDIDRRFPFILKNMLQLRNTDAQFRALSDRSLALDRHALGEDMVL